MNIKELKAIIKDLPDHVDVVIEKTEDEFNLSLLMKAEVKNITFSDGPLKAKDDCLVLSDEI